MGQLAGRTLCGHGAKGQENGEGGPSQVWETMGEVMHGKTPATHGNWQGKAAATQLGRLQSLGTIPRQLAEKMTLHDLL